MPSSNRLRNWALSATAALAIVGATSCLVENTVRCRGRVERHCSDGWAQRCDRWGCSPQYYVSCYDVCIDVPEVPVRDAASDAKSGVDAAATCLEDNQCPGGTRCSLGRCVPICLDERDCPAGWTCQRGLCIDRPATPIDASPPRDGAPVDASGVNDAAPDAPTGNDAAGD